MYLCGLLVLSQCGHNDKLIARAVMLGAAAHGRVAWLDAALGLLYDFV